MNFPNYSQLKTLLRCIPLIKSKFNLQNCIIPLGSGFENRHTFENKAFFFTSSRLLAGHSKWANIKHTKEASDRQKSLLSSKYAVLIRNACKESGGCDPTFNAVLAKVINQAKSQQVPVTTIERVIQNFQKAKTNGKPGTLSYAASGGLFILVDVHTDNLNRTRQQVNVVLKKIGFKEAQRNSVEMAFEEKGVIVAQGDLNEAVDHAIEVGAEDVTEEDSSLTFVCDPKDFYAVKKGIENLKYDVEYADIDRIPLMQHSVNEADLASFKDVLMKLEEHDEVVKVTTNANI